MISHDILLLLVGGGIGLVSAIIGSLVQYWLNIRAEKWKIKEAREYELKQQLEEDETKERIALRQAITKPGDPAQIKRQTAKVKSGQYEVIQGKQKPPLHGKKVPASLGTYVMPPKPGKKITPEDK